MRHQPRIPNNGTGCSRAFPLTSRVITGASWPLLSIGASILSGHTLQWGQRSHALEGDRVMEEQRSGCQDELMYLERPASCAPDDEACRARLPAARERVRRRHHGTGDSPCLRHRPIAHPRHALSFPASTGSEVLCIEALIHSSFVLCNPHFILAPFAGLSTAERAAETRW